MNLEKSKTKGLILADFSIDDISYFKNHIRKYQIPPTIEQFSNESLLARKDILHYFQTDFQYNLRYNYYWIYIINYTIS